jgi:membrane associated rhomboid family serine protease
MPLPRCGALGGAPAAAPPPRAPRPARAARGLRAACAAALGGLAAAALGGPPPASLSLSGSPAPPARRAAAPVATLAAAPGRGGGGAADGPLLTHALIALNAAVYGLQVLSKDALTVAGVKVNSLIAAGQWWRLATPALLHGSLTHLAVNCYSLWNLAPTVERLTGSPRLAAVYAAAALAGNAASYFGSPAPSLGASGAVFGVGGALGVYFWRNRELYGARADAVLGQLWRTLLLNLVFGLTAARIDNWGHVGGLAGGAAAAWLLGPNLRLRTWPGRSGTWLVDEPPLRLLASPPRQVRR